MLAAFYFPYWNSDFPQFILNPCDLRELICDSVRVFTSSWCMDLSDLQQKLTDYTSSENFETLEGFASEMLDFECPELAQFVRYRDDRYCRNLVYQGEDFELVLLCWKPGQRSPKHFHPDNGCVMTVIKGQLEEIRFEGSSSTKAIYDAGTVSYINGDEEHIVGNSGDQESISLHIYSPTGYIEFD